MMSKWAVVAMVVTTAFATTLQIICTEGKIGYLPLVYGLPEAKRRRCVIEKTQTQVS